MFELLVSMGLSSEHDHSIQSDPSEAGEETWLLNDQESVPVCGMGTGLRLIRLRNRVIAKSFYTYKDICLARINIAKEDKK